MLLPNLATLVAKITSPVTGALQVLSTPGSRRVWGSDGRSHIEVKGLHRPGTTEAAHALRQRLVEHDGVHGAEINAALGRVVVSHDPDVISPSELAHVVGDVERELGLHEQEPAPIGAHHPANPGPLVRDIAALGTSLLGLGLSVLGRVLPDVLPPVVPTLVSLADSVPRVRMEVEKKLGPDVADAIFALGGSASQALAQRPVALLTEVAYRVCMYREVQARRQAWQRWERGVGDRLDAHRADPVDARPRPVPLPDALVERVANISAALALAGYAVVGIGTQNAQRALSVLVAGVPRSAKLGRDAFAAQLDTDLSVAEALVLQPHALRRLDRVDAVVLDTTMLVTGRHMVQDVVPTDDEIDRTELLRRAHDLVDLSEPNAHRERDGWAAVPVDQLPISPPEHVRRAVRERASPGVTVLVVLRGDQHVGLVTVTTETDPLTDALVEAAKRAGTPVLAGVGGELAERLRVDQVVPGGNRLLESVQKLQHEGHVVALVSARGHAALAAADVGIGVPGPANAVPWNAHIVCRDLAQACLPLDAMPVARKASRHSAELSVAGSSMGAVLGALGPARSAPARAALPGQLAALLAVVAGTWWGAEPGRRSAPAPADRTPWHAMSTDAVLTALSSSRAGLDEQESERRRLEQPAEEDPTGVGLARASMEELANPLTPTLATGAGLSASIGAVTDALMISGVLGLNALISGIQQVGANRELRQLGDTSALRVRVRRGGTERTLRADQLVPGDVIELHAGDAVPADCRLVEATGLEVDESSLTGESQLVTKSAEPTGSPTVAERSSMLYQGTVVAAGQAMCAVVAIGERTEIGRASRLNGEAPPTTGVASRLRSLTKRTLPVPLGAGGGLMLLDLLRGRGASQALSRAVSLAVAAVPEGLPFVATVAELASARRLSRRGVLVRSPSTIEAIGRVNVLCFDKTGTLTEGRISLRRISDGLVEADLDDLTPPLRDVLAVAVRATPPRQPGRPMAHPTDRALLDAAARAGVAADDGLDSLQWVDELSFEPSRGYHAVLAKSSSAYLLSIKGAPEAMLARCSHWRRGDGKVVFDADARREVEAAVERSAREGYRVLAVAERTMPNPLDLDESSVRDLDFRGLLALADPVRPTAAKAVKQLRQAGVDIVMITGDHPSTAEAIAAEFDLLDTERVLTGAEVEALDQDTLARTLPKVSVFARVSPEQKALIVRELRQLGRVVAMTGDGANDVPAIRLADVGIAIGSRATPAARLAADLVVTGDRIETITDAIVEGRAMWVSVRDALSILLGGNLGEIAFTVGAGLLSSRESLNARQLLLVNLLTDVLPAMAIAMRPPPRATPQELLDEGPEASLGASLNREVYFRAGTTAGAATAGWMLARPVSTPTQASTTGLVALVGAQLGQTMTVRGRTPLVMAAGLGSLAMLVGIVQVPGVSHFFGCQPLLPHQWAIATGAAAAATGAEAIRQAMRHMVRKGLPREKPETPQHNPIPFTAVG
jgi:cation-transporting ATPase I